MPSDSDVGSPNAAQQRMGSNLGNNQPMPVMAQKRAQQH